MLIAFNTIDLENIRDSRVWRILRVSQALAFIHLKIYYGLRYLKVYNDLKSFEVFECFKGTKSTEC